MNSLSLLDLLLYGLATFRVANTFVFENGPFGVFELLRRFGKPFTCIWCISVYVGFAFALLRLVHTDVADIIALALALSALAIGLKSFAEAWFDLVQATVKKELNHG